MLTFAEEIFLLGLDRTTGDIAIPGGKTMRHRIVAGAVLCELSFLNRIDTDAEFLYVVDSSATGMKVLDDVLDAILMHDRRESINYWMHRLLAEAQDIENDVIQELQDKAMIEAREKRFFRFFPRHRYQLTDPTEADEVKARLRNLIMSDDIPEPRDAILVSLVFACNLFDQVLEPEIRHARQDRIFSLSRYDLVGQAIIHIINAMQLNSMVG